jgi:type III secretory pathway component EscS
VILTLMITVRWLGQQVLIFASNIFENIIAYI